MLIWGFLIKENDQISIIDDQVLFEDANAVEKYNSLYEEMFNNLLESENAYSDFVSKINAVFN
ncbi:MAG: hypothetical protein KKA19_05250 [Candidatus Margulisbacteria bacterium]|nr:hypothetical protein [Candidatus Margulisiibacteriota bacterium]